jgi:PAS domain S-box-containing protein
MSGSILDMRTLMLSFVVSNAVCMIVMALLWAQGRCRFRGIGFWLAAFVLQFFGAVFFAARGRMPDGLSIMGGNLMGVGSAFLLYIGLLRFSGARARQWYNWVYLAGFICVHAYFTFVEPRLGARTINLSLALFVYSAQCADLLLRRIGRGPRMGTSPAGVVLGLFALISLVRVFDGLARVFPEDMLQFGLHDTSVILGYQALAIALTFALFLMVSRRLFSDIARDVRARLAAEAALRSSDEKFAIAFQNIPEAIVLTAMENGRIVEANEAFFRMSGFSKEEALGKSTLELGLWERREERERIMDELRKRGCLSNVEVVFRNKSGEKLVVSASFELIRINESVCVLEVIRDVTAQRNAEKRSEASTAEAKRLLRDAEVSRRTLLSVVEDQQIADAAIQQQLGELRRWQSVTLDREDRVIALKREVNELAAKLGEKPRYESAGEG